MSKYSERCPNCVGATTIEFLIGGILIILFVVAMMDFAHFFSVRSVLTKGAQDGLAVARVIQDYSIDYRGLVPGSDDEKKLNAARASIEAAALHTPTGTFISDGDTGASDELKTFTIDDGSGKTFDSQVLILRPGEKAVMHLPGGGTSQPIYHPNICPTGASDCVAQGGRFRKSSETMDMLLRDYPVVVEMASDVSFISPFVGKIRGDGKAVGFRELTRRSGSLALPAIPDMTSSSTSSSSTSGVVSTSSSTTPSSSSTSTSYVQCNQGIANNYCQDGYLCDSGQFGVVGGVCVCKYCVRDCSYLVGQCQAQGCGGTYPVGDHCECSNCPCPAQPSTPCNSGCVYLNTPGTCYCDCSALGGNGS